MKESTLFDPIDLLVAPATVSESTLTLIWDKPFKYVDIRGYTIYENGIKIGTSKASVTHYTVKNLSPNTQYSYRVESDFCDKKYSSTNISVLTKPSSKIYDVTLAPYFADKKGEKKSTDAIQAAINDCCKGGTVLIPQGANILSGALDLKSNMTFQVDGNLFGSKNPEDYIISEKNKKNFPGSCNVDGLVLSRYEGWELYCYRSLLNGGYLDRDNRSRINCNNIRICGKGLIHGGGNELGIAMRTIYEDTDKYPQYVSDGIPGRRARGRLISLIQCKNVHITNVHIENPPCWTIHMIYCDTVTTNNVTIKSLGIDNGDGWDPDSSKNCMIFDSHFETGDDCIAIKSGKNPEGNIINIPAENIRIFDLKMLSGNGMAIGSEESGGVRNVYIRDCMIQNTRYGLELKAHNSRGGFVKNLEMKDCIIDCFQAHSVNYNDDGVAAEKLPYFSEISIQNTTINGKNRAVELIGFSIENSLSEKNYINNIKLENIILSKKSKELYFDYCKNLSIKNVQMSSGKSPIYEINKKNVSKIRFD
jgi:exo-poly-alpha-galacturonosidase